MVAAVVAVTVQPSLAKTLVIAASGTPEGFDGDALRPNTQKVVVQTYEGLTRYDVTKDAKGNDMLDSGKVIGHLAESWTISNDGKTVTFHLRKGVKSPYGNELTADDVEWSWNKSFAQKRTGNFIARVSNVIVGGVKAVGKYDVEFSLEAASSIFLKALTL
ncbi:MAG: ABC transporter substrate-binding protein, partial [Planctomycetota bacterium]